MSLACSKGYTDIVKMLIDCGVDVNEYDWVRILNFYYTFTQQTFDGGDSVRWFIVDVIMKSSGASVFMAACCDVPPVGFRMEEPLCCMLFTGIMYAAWKSC